MMNRKTGKVSSELKTWLWTGVNWSFNAVKSHGNLTANVLWVRRLYGCDSMLVEHLWLPFNADLFMKEKRLSVDKIGCFRLLIGGFGLLIYLHQNNCRVKIWLNQPGDDILKSLQKRLL